jgi:hypothetical protein
MLPEERLQNIARFFEQEFSYSTYQEAPDNPEQTPLARFLLQDRKGHCEYFATAAVLLCREAGIPARYAVGYAVHEGRNGKYVAREKDAHAWAIIWNKDKGKWQDFDTTPVDWFAAEAANGSSPWRWLRDLGSRAWYEFSKLRWGQTPIRTYILYGLAPIMGVLLFNILFRRRSRASRNKPHFREEQVWPGSDSEFYALEKRLAKRGIVRGPGEPLTQWLERALRDPRAASLRNPLREALILHYRYRFDPAGLDGAERTTLREHSEACLARL